MAEFKLGRLRFVWKGIWTASTAYVKDDVVRVGGKVYVCLVGNTSAGTNYGFNSDLGSGYWALMSDGVAYRSDGWNAGSTYYLGDIVKISATTYICITANVASSTFAADASKWTLLVSGFSNRGTWATSTGYQVNDVVKVGGLEYICITAHTSSATANSGFYSDSAYWNLFVNGFNWSSSWTASTYYNINDVVKVGGKEYVCTTAHTSSTGTGNTGFFTDLTANKWSIFVDGQAWRSSWAASTYYNIGDLVSYGGSVYICSVAHQSSTTLETNQSNWTLFTAGFNYLGNYTNVPTTYKVNDVVRFGPDLYICTTAFTTSTNTIDLTKFSLFVAGLEFLNTYNSSTNYALGDTVTYGGYVYTSLQSNNSNKTPTTNPTFWSVMTTGYSQQGVWSNSTAYKIGSVVNYGAYVYVCILDTTAGILPTNATYWSLLTTGVNWLGTWSNSTAYKLGDAVTLSGTSYIAVAANTNINPSTDGGTNWNVLAQGAAGNVLTTLGDTIYYSGSGNARLPIGNPNQVMKVSAGNIPSWGYFGQVTNVYYVAPGGTNTLANGNGTTIDKPFLTIAYALANAPFSGNGVIFVKSGTYTEICPMSIPANTYIVGDAIGSVTVQPTAGTNTQNMFLMRDNTGVFNLTVTGLVGTLGSANSYGTRRPGGAAYFSMDTAGSGITTTNPIIENVTILGTGASASATGVYINSTANSGSMIMTLTDLNIILSDGIGVYVTGPNARARISQVFTYYCYAGFLAENGGRISSTSSRSEFGTYGVISEGTSSAETAATGTVNTQTQQAAIAGALLGGGQVLWLEYSNAGQTYSSSSYSFTSGSGYGATVSSSNFNTNAIPEVRVITGGTGYVSVSNISQTGTTTSITLNAADTAATGAYVGMRIILSNGTGAGQYGYITAYNGTTKVASVSAESTSLPGWDVAVVGTAVATTLDTTTRYTIEPRVVITGTGTGALVRAIVTAGSITSTRIINPGSGYTGTPSIAVTDPNSSVAATFTVRTAATGVLAQPTWTSRGVGYYDIQGTISGNGFADYQATGSNIYISGLAALPTAGSNVTIAGNIYQLANVISSTGSGPYTAYVQLGTSFTTSNAPANSAAVSITSFYSFVRLQGHVFLHIGLGNTVAVGYPSYTTSNAATTANQVLQTNGGRVFYDTMDQSGTITLGNLITSNEAAGTASITANLLSISGLSQLSFAGGGATITQFSTDGTFAANSNSLVPTQAAIRSFVLAQLQQGVGTVTATSLSTGRITISGNTVTSNTGYDVLLSAGTGQFIQVNSQTNLNSAITLTSSGTLTFASGSTVTFNGTAVVTNQPTALTDIANKRYVDRTLSLNTRWTNYWV